MSVETRRSFCRVCHAACPIDVDVDTNDAQFPGGRVLAVRGVMEDPLFEGYTCIKGRQLPEQMHQPSRLRTPLRRAADVPGKPLLWIESPGSQLSPG